MSEHHPAAPLDERTAPSTAAAAVTAATTRSPSVVSEWWTARRRPFLAYVVVGFFAFLIDPFGFERAARFQFQDSVLQALVDQETAQSQVVVVLWDEIDLKTLRRPSDNEAISWPIPYGEHARALDRILTASPKSVFVDVLFKDPRPDGTLGKLKEVFQRYRGTPGGKRTHLYLANERGCGALGIRPELLEGASGALVTPVPVALRDEHTYDSVVREYPTFANKNVLTEDSPMWECATAALRMHLDAGGSDSNLRSYRWPFVLRWRGCGSAHGWRAAVRWLGELLGYDIRQDPSCLPFAVLNARDVLSETRFNDIIKPALRDKFVVYGTNLVSVGDLVNTPVHKGLVPGPIAHAMALDNLRIWNSGYLWRIPFTSDDRVRWDVGGINGDLRIRLNAVDLGLLLLGGCVFVWIRRRDSAADRSKTSGAVQTDLASIGHVLRLGWVALRSVLLPFALFSAASLVLFTAFHVAPVNVAPHIFVWIFVENVTRIPDVDRILI